jgi:hypothetical protein
MPHLIVNASFYLKKKKKKKPISHIGHTYIWTCGQKVFPCVIFSN